MKRYGVIMAGGGGTRFWPLSRKNLPKQLLNLSGRDIMVNETLDRLQGLVEAQDLFVVTNIAQAELMYTETKGRLQKDHILAEPAARNTAACIGYAAMEINKKYGDGVMCVLPSDHFIKDLARFREVIQAGVDIAEKTNQLVTIGITPTFPSTGYGYIKFEEEKKGQAYAVEEFVEKPDVETAKEYLASGRYLWNSGMFIWKASVILEQFQNLLPDIYQCLEEIGNAMGTSFEKEVIERVYPNIPKISIDYGIMERAEEVVVLAGDFGWNDVGSFDALEAIYEADENGNILYGEHVGVDTKNCISYAQNKLIATIGVEDLVIVETKDAVLVCPKERSQDVKQIVEKLAELQKNDFL